MSSSRTVAILIAACATSAACTGDRQVCESAVAMAEPWVGWQIPVGAGRIVESQPEHAKAKGIITTSTGMVRGERTLLVTLISEREKSREILSVELDIPLDLAAAEVQD